MFDGLFKSKFYSKCKSAIKLTQTRLEMIKRKRNAMEKYLKNDISDLLENGYDVNAYGRAKGLLIELNKSATYDFVDQFCERISNHLSMMDKQRECPDECKEAVASLVFAAARFADLPELRDLRSIFTGRYGNSLEAYVNLEFVEKLKAMPPTKDMKLQLLQDIALDSGIEWDSKALGQKLYNPPPSDQAYNDKCKLYKSGDEPTENRRHNENISSKDIGVESTDQNDQQSSSNSERNVAEEKTNDKKPFYYKLIPPYTKSKASKTETSLEIPSACSGGKGMESPKFNGLDGEDNRRQDDSVCKVKPKPSSVQSRHLKPPPVHDNIGIDNSDGVGKMNLDGMSLKILNEDGHDQQDEKERKMDKLLMHYNCEMGNMEAAFKPLSSQQAAVDAGNNKKNKSKKDSPPARATSLPPKPTSPIAIAKGHARASSSQPDSGHVHPKLPDYDDLVARLAALRGK